MKPRFLALARTMALSSTDRVTIGAVITRKNRMLGSGFNRMGKTSNFSKNVYKAIHAETAAVLSTHRRDLKGATIYVYRVLKSGDSGCARPCMWCTAMLVEAGVKDCFYTDENGGLGYVRF